MKRVLVVGMGGLGSPASRILAQSLPVALTLLDDDTVDASNLHRQTLYREEDVGSPKIEVAKRALEEEAKRAGNRLEVRTIEGRLVPDVARALVRDHDLVIEGADNFATKFLAADACSLERVPCVHAGAVRFSGWALATQPAKSACLRCVFEDIPRDRADTCAEAGVLGPVVGVLGAIQASLAIRILTGQPGAGVLYSYRALEGALRRSPVRPRRECALCDGAIREVTPQRYFPATCDP